MRVRACMPIWVFVSICNLQCLTQAGGHPSAAGIDCPWPTHDWLVQGASSGTIQALNCVLFLCVCAQVLLLAGRVVFVSASESNGFLFAGAPQVQVRNRRQEVCVLVSTKTTATDRWMALLASFNALFLCLWQSMPPSPLHA